MKSQSNTKLRGLPTLGGRQFWGDVHFFRGYRVQHSVLSNNYRLLSPTDSCLKNGSKDQCLQALNQIKVAHQLPEMTGRAVMLIHGLFRSSKSLYSLQHLLEKQHKSDPNFHVIPFDYPSSRLPVVELANYFKQTLESLPQIESIDLVVHSLGGILTRTYLQLTGTKRDPRLHRMVMLGVPNRGAELATRFQRLKLFKMIYGHAGQQLVSGSESFIGKLPVPDFEFGILSGARGTGKGWNPLIPGDDDGTVSVDSTKLDGARDFSTVKSLHTTMILNREVLEQTVRFLETGCFHSSGVRNPISNKDSAPEKAFLIADQTPAEPPAEPPK